MRATITGLAISFGLALAILVGMTVHHWWVTVGRPSPWARHACPSCRVQFATAHDLALHRRMVDACLER